MTRSRQAFTLIEILGSLLLFMIGWLAIIGMIVYGQALAGAAQSDATAWGTAMSVLRDPKPLGGVADRNGVFQPWTWSRVGNTWTASDGSVSPAWMATVWDLDYPGDVLVPDMAAPLCNNPAVFPIGGSPAAGAARGFVNGYYIERREQSRAADRMAQGVRLVEVRVDVYWAGYGPTEGRPLATVVDRVVRQDSP